MSSTDPSMPTRWTRLLHLGGDAWLGLAQETLYVGDENGPRREVDPGNPTGLLPCLERPYDVVLLELQEREVELSMTQGSLRTLVPLHAIPRAAVTSQIDYWVDLALDWIEHMPWAEVDTELLDLLEHESWPTQQARHRARRLRRRRST